MKIRVTPQGVEGKVDVMIDRPWESQGGKLIGSFL